MEARQDEYLSGHPERRTCVTDRHDPEFLIMNDLCTE